MEQGGPRFLFTVGRTAAFNLTAAVVTVATGILLARVLGPSGRGDYAAVIATLGLVLVFFEVGLGAATVFFTAQDDARADSYVQTALRLLLPLGLIAGVTLALATMGFLGQSPGRTQALYIAAVVVLVSFATAPAVFAMQGTNLQLWNIIRLSQPVIFALLLVGFWTSTTLNVVLVVLLFGASLTLQAVLAWCIYLKERTTHGQFTRALMHPMLRYGVRTMAASAPNAVNGRVDQVVLALLVAPAALGQYAVAVSLSLIVAPLSMAFGNVAFPRLAKGGDSSATARQAIGGSYLVATCGVVAATATAPFFVPLVYGPGYEDVPALLFILAPGAIFFLVNQVLGDLLRGMGNPGHVAVGEWTGVVVTGVGLFTLVPWLGPEGAAATSSVTYILVHVLLRFQLRRMVHRSATARGLDSG